MSTFKVGDRIRLEGVIIEASTDGWWWVRFGNQFNRASYLEAKELSHATLVRRKKRKVKRETEAQWLKRWHKRIVKNTRLIGAPLQEPHADDVMKDTAKRKAKR